MIAPDEFNAWGERLPKGTRRQINKELALFRHLFRDFPEITLDSPQAVA